MKFAYEDLGCDQFEKLVILICQHLLGISVQGFSNGPDGGRDAKFVGTAEKHPSSSSQWKGTTIIQAKHTNGHNRSFSELDFFNENSKSAILSKEIIRINKLVENKQLDNYMLFSNRKLTGNYETKIRSYIYKKSGIPEISIYICGVEQIELWLKSYPNIVTQAALDLVDSPLIVSPDELAEVVEALSNQKDSIATILDDPPSPRVSYSNKNQINNMSNSYAMAQQQKFLKETEQIRKFLANPENDNLLRTYKSVVDEFQLKIIAKRKDYQEFDQVMEYLVDLLFHRDPVLTRYKRITRSVLFYMYWNCDIGESSLDSESH